MVIRAIAKSLSVSNEQLRIETPSNHGSGDDIVITVGVGSLGYIKKLSPSTGISRPEELAV